MNPNSAESAISEAAPETLKRWAWLHPKAYLGAYWLIGLVVSAAAAWAFFAIAEDVPESGTMVHLDTFVTEWLQRHGTEYGETFYSGVSMIGGPILTALLIIVAVVLVARRHWGYLALLAITSGGGELLNVLLKTAFHRARPSFAAEFSLTTWSFPSGHAMGSLIGYGVLTYLLTQHLPRHRRVLWGTTAALVILIGFARIYLGVHYLSDVVAGYSAGLVWLMVCFTGFRFAERRRVGPAKVENR